MEFGIFTIGDVTTDPTNGTTPTEAERIKAVVTIAKHAEEAGLDVFATGQHHNPPFVAPANPPVLLANIAAQTERIQLSTATTLITTTDPVRIAEDYSYLQHLAGGRVDLTDGPRQHRSRLPVVRQGHPPGHPARSGELQPALSPVAREEPGLGRQLSARRWTPSPSPRGRWTTCRRSCGTARSAARRSRSRPPTTATASSTTTSSGPPATRRAW